MPNLLLNEGWKVLLQSTESVINGGETRRMTSWAYPMEEKEEEADLKGYKTYYLSNVSL